MTEQEVFDQVVAHLRKQGYRKSVDSTGNCAYRGNHGQMCAVACLLPNELSRTDLESRSASWVCRQFTTEEWPASAHPDLLTKLQRIHDGHMENQTITEFNFKGLAKDFGLTYTPPQGVPA